MRTVLVTGTAGYIGSVVTEFLVKEGCKVIGIDNFQSSRSAAVNSEITFYEGNFGDKRILNDIFSGYKIDYVFHFAAETTVDFSLTDPAQYFYNNIVNGLALLDKMREYKCSNIIFSSTAATFGEPIYTPIDEEHPKKPINSYGESKLMFENILEWYHKAYGLKYNLFRYFNAAGATDINGEDRTHETHLLPLVLDSAVNGKNNLKIFGNDYPTKDGTCVRDYVHVEDIAAGHLLAMDNLDKNPNARYNLGSGVGFSILEVIDTVEKITGKKITYTLTERRKGDPAVLVASNNLAIKELNWKPAKSSLETIVKDAYAWIQKLNTRS